MVQAMTSHPCEPHSDLVGVMNQVYKELVCKGNVVSAMRREDLPANMIKHRDK